MSEAALHSTVSFRVLGHGYELSVSRVWEGASLYFLHSISCYIILIVLVL